jgi:hypothetical protein
MGSLVMRGPAKTEDPASEKIGEVHIPRPWEIGKTEGAPPADQLPPGALGGPVRAPKPFVPSDDALRDSLGPRMKADGDGGYKEDRARFSARVDRDGSVHFKDKANVHFDGFEGLGALVSFDLTEAVMRAMGDDPYVYEKMLIMERTREVRAGMKVAERQDRLYEATRRLPAFLDKIWRQSKWTAAEKRRLLFALWDEVDDTGAPEVVRASAAVQGIIVAFIRKRLPEGAPEAFTVEEIAAMNGARHTKNRFAPYAP